MKKLKQQILLMTIGTLVLVGCASSPMKELKPSEMVVGQQNKYVEMQSSESLQAWEKGLWEYTHKNYTKARKLLEPHKNRKVSMIQHAFGYMSTTGEGGIQRDFKKAEKYYKRAIKIDNYPNSLHNLAALYFNGWGSLGRDDSYILELYQKAAKKGYALSQYSLGNIYHFGRNGFSQDYGKAYYWYQQASNQGHAKAARRIGYMYENENGFKKDIEKAFEWHKLAATRGNSHSRGDMIRLKSELYKKNKNR